MVRSAIGKAYRSVTWRSVRYGARGVRDRAGGRKGAAGAGLRGVPRPSASADTMDPKRTTVRCLET
ncbi:hypothetical protein GCM10010293_44220 [Streptomyces griseoflavus]|nr:hypothetical protein GCM10010293_44220 [Streptomyces griseoflavus]